jgi:serine/threonine protein kinase
MKVIGNADKRKTKPCGLQHHVLERIRDTPFLVKLHYAFQKESKLHLVLDYCIGGDMWKLLRTLFVLEEEELRFYLAEIILAVEELHKIGFIHGDLKPGNILIDHLGHIALTDFGTCEELLFLKKVKPSHSIFTTLPYMAPEMVRGEGYGMAADWWSIGIIACELLTGVTPFAVTGKVEDHEILLNQILTHEPEMPLEISPVMADLITQLLEKEPSKRLGGGEYCAVEIKSHPFFSDVNWTDVAQKAIEPPYVPTSRVETPDSDAVRDRKSGSLTHPWALQGVALLLLSLLLLVTCGLSSMARFISP